MQKFSIGDKVELKETIFYDGKRGEIVAVNEWSYVVLIEGENRRLGFLVNELKLIEAVASTTVH